MMPEPREQRSPTRDIALALVFALLTTAFVVLMAANPTFFSWAFARHHNVLSWYVRPLFLVPFCLFAHRRSLAGMALTLFLLATSMCWFPAPAATPPSVAEFLRVEMVYLTGAWTPGKVLTSLLVPLTLGLLAVSLWRRNVGLGLGVLVLIAALKMTWSVVAAGRAGLSVFVPALVGLALCAGLIGVSLRGSGPPRAQRRRNASGSD